MSPASFRVSYLRVQLAGVRGRDAVRGGRRAGGAARGAARRRAAPVRLDAQDGRRGVLARLPGAPGGRDRRTRLFLARVEAHKGKNDRKRRRAWRTSSRATTARTFSAPRARRPSSWCCWCWCTWRRSWASSSAPTCSPACAARCSAASCSPSPSGSTPGARPRFLLGLGLKLPPSSTCVTHFVDFRLRLSSTTVFCY